MVGITGDEYRVLQLCSMPDPVGGQDYIPFTPAEEEIAERLEKRGLVVPCRVNAHVTTENVTAEGRTAMVIYEALTATK
jgi:cation diffusion facilitator CzcD-associated flavoprotein CzcO